LVEKKCKELLTCILPYRSAVKMLSGIIRDIIQESAIIFCSNLNDLLAYIIRKTN
jgi:hypothetical protein